MISRRAFLRGASLVALAPSVPKFLARGARGADGKNDGRILVVIQLSGGNDGINTVVPFSDEGYPRARQELRLAEEKLRKIDKDVGLHPSMGGAAKLLESGRLAIVQGVGYPNPNRSHDVSMAIWHTARFDPEEHRGFGWIGRALDSRPEPAAGTPGVMLVGGESPPVALQSRRSIASALSSLDDLTLSDFSMPSPPSQNGASGDDIAAFVRRSALDAYTTAERLKEISSHGTSSRGTGTSGYPNSEFSRRLGLVAQLIKAEFKTPIYYVIQSGYDTHAAQLQTHANLLRDFSGGLLAFLDDMQGAGLADRVAVLAFSEFGRRVEENGSLGTDHGTAGPVFVAGGNVQGGLVGPTPSLTDLDGGDLKSGIDFRQVYASVLENWLRIRAAEVLGQRFEPLKLFRA